MDEKSRDQKHESHEEAVIEQHDQVEAEPAHPVAVAEIGVVDDGMMDDHQKGDEGARAVEPNDAFRGQGLIVFESFAQHLLGFRTSSVIRIQAFRVDTIPQAGKRTIGRDVPSYTKVPFRRFGSLRYRHPLALHRAQPLYLWSRTQQAPDEANRDLPRYRSRYLRSVFPPQRQGRRPEGLNEPGFLFGRMSRTDHARNPRNRRGRSAPGEAPTFTRAIDEHPSILRPSNSRMVPAAWKRVLSFGNWCGLRPGLS